MVAGDVVDADEAFGRAFDSPAMDVPASVEGSTSSGQQDRRVIAIRPRHAQFGQSALLGLALLPKLGMEVGDDTAESAANLHAPVYPINLGASSAT